jgi:GTP-binding protein
MRNNEMRVLEATFVASAPKLDSLPPVRLPEAAFVGRSNVGKSSLIATLLDRKKLVRVSRRPGRTQAINLFDVRTDEGPLTLVDLPGYGYAEAPAEERMKWGPLITGYLESRSSLCLIALLLDPRRGLSEDDDTVINLLLDTGRPLIVVATKIDKVSKSKRKPAVTKLERELQVNVLPFSAKTGDGRDELLHVVGRACGIV